MSLTSVKMSEDVWLTCLTHSLSTETEEIMGLLLGDIEVALNQFRSFFNSFLDYFLKWVFVILSRGMVFWFGIFWNWDFENCNSL